jgi:hypothetical protein
MRRVLVGNNQSIWDIVVQEYGSYDGVKQLIIDNPTKCDFENSIDAGTELLIKGDVIDKSIFDWLFKKSLKPATSVSVPFNPVWILTTGTWNDSAFWEDNALWID